MGGSPRGTLIEHWSGNAWKVQASANLGPVFGPFSMLYGVAATSSRNAWAVGEVNGSFRALIEHWNGKAWKVQPSPSPRSLSGTRLLGVAATSSTNAWAVGNAGFEGQPVIEHWNGKAWKVQAFPAFTYGELPGVAATSSTNAWAVGYDGNGALIEHWNGKTWKVQKSPNLGRINTVSLFAVAATSSTNAWAVGDSGTERTLIEHWNGKSWKVQASPNLAGELLGVAAASSTRAWAVGQGHYRGTDADNPILHWNGKAWKVEASPNLPRNSTFLEGVAAASARNAWAVGYSGDQAIIEHCG